MRVRSSRDSVIAVIECDGTHFNDSVTLGTWDVIEETDLTKDEVEQLVVKLGEVVDVLNRREAGELSPMAGTMIERLFSGLTRPHGVLAKWGQKF